jgi:glucose-6-phosphate isomerase
MRVDIGNALEAVHGVSEASLERLDDRVARAHDRIETAREAGEHGYVSLDLPATTDPEPVREAAAGFEDVSAVLNVGIGGSALGAATVSHALGNEPPAYFLDNVDPERTGPLLDALDLSDVVVNVVSKSGTTAETLGNFLLVRERMEAAGVDWTDRTVVTTGESGNLRRLSEKHDLPAMPVPDGVPGRFSVLSPVGMFAAAVQGHDLDALLAGARAQMESLSGSLFETPAYAYGATTYALAKRGCVVNAMMPYAEALEEFAEWFAQLWAESLGKDGLGQTPARALGATDQHSQLQLYRAGPRDKLVTMVRPADRTDLPFPETDLEGLAYLSDHSLGDLLDAEFEATEASLAAADVPNVRIEVDRLDAHGLGELLYAMEAATVLYGELEGVGTSTFEQPAVEWGKRAARGLLGEGDYEEADLVRDKRTLVVE